MARTQTDRLIGADSLLGPDVLLLRRFYGTERLGRLFHYELDLLSEKHAIDFTKIVGQKMTARISKPGGDTRYFNGFVSRFLQTRKRGRLSNYRATLVPWLWFLTRTSDCRIFQEKTIPEIIMEVFRDNGYTDFQDRLKPGYRKWVNCVQYRETDFNFVSRLMELEGIYYYFQHEDGKHTLVLVDSMSAHQAYPGYAQIPYRPPDQAFSEKENIYDWTVENAVQPGAYAQNDFDFEVPKKPLLTKSKIARQHVSSDHEVYDYPGDYVEYNDGEDYARVRIEELQTPHETARGETDAQGISTGYKFNFTGFPRQDQCREHLVTSANYEIVSDEFDSSGERVGGETVYNCTFTAIDAKETFRPARITPKPVIQGPQTALVVGKKGEEIWTDKYGRVKVQFHWDRYGESDENSSCWIRAAQAWAGKGWGAMHIPRIGQEVVVDFLEGDPDRPIITGSVYNGDQMPAYSLPAEMTKSWLKSNSTKGGVGYNEIRFEDKKDKEQIFVHAERNMDVRVKNDRMENVGGNQHLIVGVEESGDQRELVHKDKHLAVHGNQIEHIGGDKKLLVGGKTAAGDMDIAIQGAKKETIGTDQHLHVKANRNEKVDMTTSLTVGMNQQEKVSLSHALEAGMDIHLKAGMNVVIEGGLQLTLKGAGGFITIGPMGVAIQGNLVTINSGGAAGVGAGSSPTAPQDAAEAAPVEPDVADKSKTGTKSAPG